jgi:hypothetical protein
LRAAPASKPGGVRRAGGGHASHAVLVVISATCVAPPEATGPLASFMLQRNNKVESGGLVNVRRDPGDA